MDIDSPTSHRSEDNVEDNDDDNDDVSGYDAQLLELEPLREDSDDDEDLIDGNDNNDNDKQEDDSNAGDDNEQAGSSSSGSSEDDEEEEDTHVQGLTSNEREILTLLAVDKKLASLLDLAANALSALRPKEVFPQDANTANTDTLPQSEEPSKAFEKASAEYYKALDDIQLTLRNSIHLIRKARISPRTLMENPSLGSVLSNTSGGGAGASDPSKEDNNERVGIAPGVVKANEGSDGLSRGAMRMEIETWKLGIGAMRGLLESLNTKAPSTNGQ